MQIESATSEPIAVPLFTRNETLLFTVGLLTVLGTLLGQCWSTRHRTLAVTTGVGLSLMVAVAGWSSLRQRMLYKPFVRAQEQTTQMVNAEDQRTMICAIQEPLPGAVVTVEREGEAIQVSAWLHKATERTMGVVALDGADSLLTMSGGNGDAARHVEVCFRINQALTQWLGENGRWIIPVEAAMSDQLLVAIGAVIQRCQFQKEPVAVFAPTQGFEWTLKRQFDSSGRLAAVHLAVTQWGCLASSEDHSQVLSPQLGPTLEGVLIESEGQFRLSRPELRLYAHDGALLWGRRYDAQGNSVPLCRYAC